MIRQATGLWVAALAVAGILATGGVESADTPAGKAIFDRNCAACHAAGSGHPGTERLSQLRGPSKAVLEQRTDLDPVYIRVVVRQGLVEMAPWRPTEISDAELAQLAQYLGRRKK